MRRFYVEVVCRVEATDLDAAVDQLSGALADEPGLIDADLSAELATGKVTVGTSVDAADESAAVGAALVGFRSAAHKAGASTPGWEANTAEVTVFPAAEVSHC
jgi:hypothetical protein